MRPGLDSRSLQVGPSSGPRLPREDWAGWHHIGGQDVELTLLSSSWLSYCISNSVLNFRCAFELCCLYLNLLCKTGVVN